MRSKFTNPDDSARDNDELMHILQILMFLMKNSDSDEAQITLAVHTNIKIGKSLIGARVSAAGHYNII